MKIVFFGTPNYAVTILDYLKKQGGEILAVISRPDKPKGRSKKPQPTPVKLYALEHDLPLYQPEKASEPEFAAFLKNLNADFFIVAAFAEILKENVLSAPRLACINVHASILPRYRGAAPIPRSIMAGDTETGVTIMKMALEMDAGEIFKIVKTPIPLTMTTGELTEKLANLGAAALWEVLQAIEAGTAQPTPQDLSQVTFAKKIKSEEGEVNWNCPCEVIHNQIRGVTPNPGAWCLVEVRGQKKRLKIMRSLPFPERSGSPKELLSQNNKELVVGCQKGALKLLEVQLEGKKAMEADAFLRGVGAENLKF